jgi:hypothetical protein
MCYRSPFPIQCPKEIAQRLGKLESSYQGVTKRAGLLLVGSCRLIRAVALSSSEQHIETISHAVCLIHWEKSEQPSNLTMLKMLATQQNGTSKVSLRTASAGLYSPQTSCSQIRLVIWYQCTLRRGVAMCTASTYRMTRSSRHGCLRIPVRTEHHFRQFNLHSSSNLSRAALGPLLFPWIDLLLGRPLSQRSPSQLL